MNIASTLTSATNTVQQNINKVQAELVSGHNSLDPAQQGVVTRLNSQATGFKAVGDNITQAQNVISVAQTGLTSIATVITQMQKLANQAATGTVSTADKVTLKATFDNLKLQIANIGISASVNGVNLLGAGAVNVQTGIGGTVADATSVTAVDIPALLTAMGNLDISTGATAAITALDTALNSVGTAQSSLSASSVGLESQSSQAASLVKGLQNTIDSIQKIDAPAAQVKLTELNTQQSIGYYLINQMNTATQSMLTIFR